MKKLTEVEKRPFIYSSEEEFKANITNNIRWLYIEMYDEEQVCNVKSFAEKCHTPQSTVESWLRDGVVPQPEARSRVERSFGRRDGSLVSENRPLLTNWKSEYDQRNGAKPTMRKYGTVNTPEAVAAETSHSYAAAKKDLKTLCEELLKCPDFLATNQEITAIVQKWT